MHTKNICKIEQNKIKCKMLALNLGFFDLKWLTLNSLEWGEGSQRHKCCTSSSQAIKLYIYVVLHKII